ncbi:hypothetical protein BKG82_27865 [Mycobacteroides chelonae]|uniref:Uncharacterized protein n=1 Tax=Mycobacteroides chelonae TaxID=1774 RepID=A0A1S1LJ59_MYCCH|nr:hypothetical protein [Mycobacteroides chelonae]OHU47426.1 hypothetical protein BKG82_27865 [Mycobacteroides chelonae]
MALAQQALGCMGVAGAELYELGMLGTRAFVAVEMDHEEISRRKQAGTPALTDRLLLRELGSLPYLEQVARADLSPVALKVLRRAPDGVVELGETYVMRTVRPAVTLRGAVTVGHDWRGGLNAVSPFAAFCPRLFVLTTDAADIEHAALEAGLYGIGLARGGDKSVELHVHPEHPSVLFGPVAWRVQEIALEAADC